MGSRPPKAGHKYLFRVLVSIKGAHAAYRYFYQDPKGAQYSMRRLESVATPDKPPVIKEDVAVKRQAAAMRDAVRDAKRGKGAQGPFVSTALQAGVGAMPTREAKRLASAYARAYVHPLNSKEAFAAYSQLPTRGFYDLQWRALDDGLPDIVGVELDAVTTKQVEAIVARHGLTPKVLRYALGVPHGGLVSKDSAFKPKISIATKGKDELVLRLVGTPSDTVVQAGLRPGQDVVIFERRIELPRGEQHKGAGTKLLVAQVSQIPEIPHGSKPKLRLHAAGEFGTPVNGYYTWAQLGFVPVDQTVGPHQESFEHLMSTPAGAAWWRVNGKACVMEFDASPGSYSMRRLEWYARNMWNAWPSDEILRSEAIGYLDASQVSLTRALWPYIRGAYSSPTIDETLTAWADGVE